MPFMQGRLSLTGHVRRTFMKNRLAWSKTLSAVLEDAWPAMTGVIVERYCRSAVYCVLCRIVKRNLPCKAGHYTVDTYPLCC